MLPEPSSFVSLVELHMHRSLSTKEKDLALLLLLILQSLEAPIWLLQGMTRSSKVFADVSGMQTGVERAIVCVCGMLAGAGAVLQAGDDHYGRPQGQVYARGN